MKDENWEDLRLFLQVARGGGLTAAAQTSGMSPPTIGRRMLALERAFGRSLFHRRPTGYVLSVDGEALLERVKNMEAAARSVEEWQQDVLALPIVSVAMDSLTLRFVTRQMDEVWCEEDRFRVCLKAIEGEIDLTYRDAQIAVTSARPHSGNVAAKRSVKRAYCAYRSGTVAQARRWVSIGTDVATAPWLRWTFQRHELPVEAWTNTPRSLLDLALAGAGNTVLPCFVGDEEAGLVRTGPPIDELADQIWIVAHADDRVRGEVRTVIDRLDALFAGHRHLFGGRTVLPEPRDTASKRSAGTRFPARR